MAFDKWHTAFPRPKHAPIWERREVRFSVGNAMGSVFLWVGQARDVSWFSSRN